MEVLPHHSPEENGLSKIVQNDSSSILASQNRMDQVLLESQKSDNFTLDEDQPDPCSDTVKVVTINGIFAVGDSNNPDINGNHKSMPSFSAAELGTQPFEVSESNHGLSSAQVDEKDHELLVQDDSSSILGSQSRMDHVLPESEKSDNLDKDRREPCLDVVKGATINDISAIGDSNNRDIDGNHKIMPSLSRSNHGFSSIQVDEKGHELPSSVSHSEIISTTTHTSHRGLLLTESEKFTRTTETKEEFVSGNRTITKESSSSVVSFEPSVLSTSKNHTASEDDVEVIRYSGSTRIVGSSEQSSSLDTSSECLVSADKSLHKHRHSERMDYNMDDEVLRQHWTQTLEDATSKGEIVEEIVRILKEQKSHDVMCPVCGSCITKRVILRKRKRTGLMSLDRWYQEPVEPIDSTIKDLEHEIQIDSEHDSLPATETEAYGCLSCFSLFFRKVFGRRDTLPEHMQVDDDKSNISCLTFFFPPYYWGINEKKETISKTEEQQASGQDSIMDTAGVDNVERAIEREGQSVAIQKQLDLTSGLGPVLVPDTIPIPTTKGSPSDHISVIDIRQQISATTTLPSTTTHEICQDFEVPQQFPAKDISSENAQVEQEVEYPSAQQESEVSIISESKSEAKKTLGQWRLPSASWFAGKGSISDELKEPLLQNSQKQEATYDDIEKTSISSKWFSFSWKSKWTDKSESKLPAPLTSVEESSERVLNLEPPFLRDISKDEEASVKAIAQLEKSEDVNITTVLQTTIGTGRAEAIVQIHSAEDTQSTTLVSEVGKNLETPTEQESKGWEILRSIIYGGLDISIASLGVVSSAAGGDAITRTVVYMGLATLISGIIAFYHNILRTFTEQRDHYRQLVGESLRLHGTLAVISYFFFGMLAPLTYAFTFRESDNKDYKFAATCGVSAVGVILLSLGKARVSHSHYFNTVTGYLTGDVCAAIVGYLTGEHVSKLLEEWGI